MNFASTCAAAILISTACHAEIDGIQNHKVQKMFMTEPCTAVITTIDKAKPTPEGIGNMAMAFGFLMGFEADHPGIRGDHETILTRLRTDCSADSTKTAFEMLQGYAAE